MLKTSITDRVESHLLYTLGKNPDNATSHDVYTALCYAVRDRMVENHLVPKSPRKEVAYLSAEFLIGPQLSNNLLNLDIRKDAEGAVGKYGYGLEEILDHSVEPGLGNGGLGRLAACYMESMATLRVPATGYGIRYKYGIFKQTIKDNQQVEVTDNWLHGDWPWELCYPDESVMVGFGGKVERYGNKVRWVPEKNVVAVPYDVLQAGYKVDSCAKIRLWRADAIDVFDFKAFNQ